MSHVEFNKIDNTIWRVLKMKKRGETGNCCDDAASETTLNEIKDEITTIGDLLLNSQVEALLNDVKIKLDDLATETTLSNIKNILPTSLGQKTSGNSFPVVFPSDQSLATETTLSTINTKLPASLGQKNSASSFPVVFANDQSLNFTGTANLGTSDIFGRTMVSTPKTLFSSKLTSPYISNLEWDTSSSGSGSSTYNSSESSYTLNVGIAIGKTIRQTYQRFFYIPGKAQTIYMTGILSSVSTGIQPVGITSKMGYYDDNNGLYFQSNSLGVSVCIKNSIDSTITSVPQANWNINTGAWIDWTKTQIFVITYQWLGVGLVKFGIYDSTGSLQFLHQIPHANIGTTVYMKTPNLPVRYEIETTGSSVTASMKQICSAVINESGETFSYYNRTLYMTSSVHLDTGSWYPLLVIKLKTDSLDAIVKATKISVVCTTGTNFIWKLVLNPTFSSPISYDNSDSTTTIQKYISVTNTITISGGIDIDSDVIYSGSSQGSSSIIDLQESLYSLGSKIDGTPIPLCFSVYLLTGTNKEFYASLGYSELV